jgi:ribonuclease HII
MLQSSFTDDLTEAGCDEAGRGCLAGPVFAAAVILPAGYEHPLINDSKKLSPRLREQLRIVIEQDALAWSVAFVPPEEIDEINILNASFRAIHKAVAGLAHKPDILLVDGNRFAPYSGIPHRCFVKGDGLFLSIAAASILAKTYRDRYMQDLHIRYPDYGWDRNKGYPSPMHRQAIAEKGLTPVHRKSFHLKGQLKIEYF